MSGKTIFIIIVTALVTLVLFNNTEDMGVWLFGVSKIPKLAVLGSMLGLGFIMGFIAGRPKRKAEPVYDDSLDDEGQNMEPYLKEKKTSRLSDEDRDYIS